jgi:hypothetical protein
MIRMLILAMIFLTLSCCASLPERPQETSRTPRIIEEDITNETSRHPASPSGPEHSGTVVVPSPQDSQELGTSTGSSGPKPPRRIIWRDQGVKDRKQQ